jgi:hypothetical protein
MTEADCAAKYGRATEMHAAGLQHDGLVQRLMLEPIILSEEDAE